MKFARIVGLFRGSPARPNAGRNGAEELAFLPAALEIVDTPPSPVGRAIGATVILAFCVALGWAAFGGIDIVASAQGKIVPSDRVKVIQALEIGVVRTLNVQDGQTVKAGQLLLEIDPTINQAEARQSKRDLLATRLDIARLRAALVETGDSLQAYKPPADATPEQIAEQQRHLHAQVGEHRAKLAALDRQRQQKEAEVATIAASIAKLEAMLPVMKERFDIRKTLHSAELGSRLQYLELLQALTEMQQELLVQKSHLPSAVAAAAAVGDARAQVVAEFRRTQFDDLGRQLQRESAFIESLVKAEQRARLQDLRAPVDGTVQQLAVHTVGGVITPSQELMVIVPSGSRLEVEAMISNRDVGFVAPGQNVEIKIDTFNFTKYGLIEGHVLNISQDSIRRPKPLDTARDKSQGASSGSSEPPGQEMVYAARISLDRSEMKIENRQVQLTAGMAVTAEIKTGTRSVLSYLLSPILRFTHESMRER